MVPFCLEQYHTPFFVPTVGNFGNPQVRHERKTTLMEGWWGSG